MLDGQTYRLAALGPTIKGGRAAAPEVEIAGASVRSSDVITCLVLCHVQLGLSFTSE